LHQQTRAPRSEHQPACGTEQSEHHTLGEELPDEARRSGAQRGANRAFAATGGRTHQQQIRHVGAGDEQHQADRTEQQQQRAPAVAHHHLGHRHELGADILVRPRPNLFETCRNRLEVVGRPLALHARMQPGDNVEKARAGGSDLVASQRQRHPEVLTVLQGFSVSTHHAHNRVGHVVQCQGAAQRG